MASITVVSGPNEGDYYPLGHRTSVIGRDERVPIQIRDDLVSRRHVQIRYDEGDDHYHLLDMNSANGTFVQGRQITSDLVLEDNDIIELGNSRLMFSLQDFKDRESALHFFKQRGERGKSTLVR
jgi:pSer/pThr/pTyr-binding forkhead associated (FHA) protein